METITNLNMDKKQLHFNQDVIKSLEEEIFNFIQGESYLQTDEFVKKVMLRREIKTNNLIEGITDDLTYIDEIIRNKSSKIENKRILNLYRGYKYILTNPEINQENLNCLYNILSDSLLKSSDMAAMGEYYRTEPVLIYSTKNSEKPFMGVNVDKLEDYMNSFFDYINNQDKNISKFIKSQIMHFYFVYIHPYFDVNGRCARTVSMWYLLNNHEYPFIIFNRGISLSRKDYIKNIVLARDGNITPFLKYMLETVKAEFEKEYLSNNLVVNSGYSLSKEEYEVLCYFLSLKGEVTVKDLATIYNRYNNHTSLEVIINEKLKPLIEKGIILLKEETNSYIGKDLKNRVLGLNPNFLELKKNNVNYINIKKFIKNN